MPHPQKVLYGSYSFKDQVHSKIELISRNQCTFFAKSCLPVDKSNIFTADMAEENEVENVRFKKSLEYAVTGLSINQDRLCFSNSN